MSETKTDFAEDIKTALAHAGAWLLLELAKTQRGYATIEANEPAVMDSVEVAKKEAAARGASDDAIGTIQQQHVIQTAQELGAGGFDPHAVLADTKASDGPEEDQVHAEPSEPSPFHPVDPVTEPVAEPVAAAPPAPLAPAEPESGVVADKASKPG